MCRNIKPLFNFEPAVTEDEIRAAALQYVRKISGYNKPSKVNEVAFDEAVTKIALVSQKLLDALETGAPKRNRELEAERLRLKQQRRFKSPV